MIELIYSFIFSFYPSVDGKKRSYHDPAEREMEIKKITQKIIIELEVMNQRAEEKRLANERFEKEGVMRVVVCRHNHYRS